MQTGFQHEQMLDVHSRATHVHSRAVQQSKVSHRCSAGSLAELGTWALQPCRPSQQARHERPCRQRQPAAVLVVRSWTDPGARCSR
eukprot:363954-Chlamydomonas_euryale.AAC.2